MKKFLAMLMSMLLLAMMAGTALATDTATTPQAPQANGMAQDGNLSGRITAVGSGSLTLSVFGGGQPPQNGDNASGNGQPSGEAPSGEAPSGEAPQGGGQTNQGGQGGNSGGQPSGNGQQGGGQGGGQPGGGQPPQRNNDASPDANTDANTATPPTETEQQTVTVTVSSSTSITTGTDSTALSLSDLTVGMMVSVKVSGDATSGYTAESIHVRSTTQEDAAPDTDTATTSKANPDATSGATSES